MKREKNEGYSAQFNLALKPNVFSVCAPDLVLLSDE